MRKKNSRCSQKVTSIVLNTLQKQRVISSIYGHLLILISEIFTQVFFPFSSGLLLKCCGEYCMDAYLKFKWAVTLNKK